MKVSGIGTTGGPGQTRRTGKTDKTSQGFAQMLPQGEDAIDDIPSVDAPAAVGGIEALLAAQGVDDSLERESRRRMVKRGEDILDKLEELRRDLLLGEVPKENLIALAQMVRSRRDNIADPRLAGLLDEIELRAEVELAKLSSRKP